MKATCSFSTGLCYIPEEARTGSLINALTATPVPVQSVHLEVANVDDWQCVEADDVTSLMTRIQSEHILLRALLNLDACLLGVRETTSLQLLKDVEDLLQTGLSVTRLQSRLLAAPLKHRKISLSLATQALAEGLGALGNLLESVYDQQPQLARLVGHWFQIPESEFIEFPGGRTALWRLLVAEGQLVSALEATDNATFKQTWSGLAFRAQEPQARTAIGRVGSLLADCMFPHQQIRSADSSKDRESFDDPGCHQTPRRGKSRKANATTELERALRQVNAIVELVAKGQDTQARKYLRELVEAQTADQRMTEHAVKSLCNIAKQCADCFRTDFERECLQTAIELRSSDAWTLVQLGDHYKRIGDYDSALASLQQAKACGEPTVAESATADVYAQMGDYQRAIAHYQSIEDPAEKPLIRTAIADNLRRLKRFDEAAAEYDQLIRDGFASHRTLAGKAEIDRRQGLLGRAISTYESILKSPDLDPNSALVYRCSLAQILKQSGDLGRAYQLADDVAQKSPFAMTARILRASILGLQGRAAEAIQSLPDAQAPKAFGEWIQQYVRGLLLLQLDRYTDAREELVSNLESRFVVGDSQAIMRLAAAVSFLHKQTGVDPAKNLLANVIDTGDYYADYLAGVLRYHVAVAEQDRVAIQQLEERLHSDRLPEGPLRLAFLAIRDRNWKEAWRHEVSALLRLAA